MNDSYILCFLIVRLIRIIVTCFCWEKIKYHKIQQNKSIKPWLTLLFSYIHKNVQELGKSVLRNEKSVCETRDVFHIADLEFWYDISDDSKHDVIKIISSKSFYHKLLRLWQYYMLRKFLLYMFFKRKLHIKQWQLFFKSPFIISAIK